MATERIRADDLLRLGCQAVKPVAQVNRTAREKYLRARREADRVQRDNIVAGDRAVETAITLAEENHSVVKHRHVVRRTGCRHLPADVGDRKTPCQGTGCCVERANAVMSVAVSRMTMRNIRQNLVFAFAYNVIGIPVAVGVLYPTFGILLSPAVAALAMSLSSVSVIANALRLRAAQL